MAGALNGVRVIDFGQYMAGPMAAMLLGDQGADVIRVDPPGGPRWDTPANATWNRNKRSIVLDLKQDADRDTARKLIAGADVVIENFRPGVMDRLGVGAAEMTAANPRLIYCSLPGFGADDPRAQVRAWEGVVGAAIGTYRPSPTAGTGRPVYSVVPYASAYGAFLCAVTVAMALNERQRSGQGQRADIPLFDASFTVVGTRGTMVNGKPTPDLEFDWSRPLQCKDGRWLMCTPINKKFEDFLRFTGMDRWRDAKLPPKELGEKYAEAMKTRTAQEWEDVIAELGSEAVICHSSAEWLKHPHALESKIIADFEDPQLGKFRGPGINVRLSATPGSVRSPRPKTDAHREEILKEIAAHKPAAESGGGEVLRSALQGVKVLDLCIVLAGPTCGRTLAEFGADVIKIDSPHRNPVLKHNDINCGKRSVLLDLKTKEGLEIFWKLVDQADVVVQNYRLGVAEDLGIGYEQVKARKPGIVYASMNTFGHVGPYADRPGHEGIGQACSGLQVRFGGSQKPTVASFAANDYGTGLMVCYGVALALLHRQRTGQGQFVDSCLAYTASMLQSALLQDYPGKQWNEPHGQEALGKGPLDRLYQASDGWLYFAAGKVPLSACPELADLASRSGSELERALEERMKQRTVAAWVETLTRAGMGAHHNVSNMLQLMTDPLTLARGLSVTRDHEDVGSVTTTAPGMKLSRTPVVLGAPASKPGKDVPSVLEDIGLRGELDRLIRDKIVVVDGVKAE